MDMSAVTRNLAGRLIALNMTKCKRFSCGGFSINFNSPSAVVMPDAQQEQIRTGILDGRLVDITDQNINGLAMSGTQHTKPVLEDTGEKVFITVGANGMMSVAIPKDSKELEEFEKRIETDGSLILDSPEISSTISPLVQGRVDKNHKFSMLDNFSQTVTNIKRSS